MGNFGDEIRNLRDRQLSSGNEHAFPYWSIPNLANINDSRILRGKITMGNHFTCKVNTEPPQISSGERNPVLTCTWHTHPISLANKVFSDTDFLYYLASPTVVLEGMVTHEFGLLMMKTNSTPNCSLESVKHRMSRHQSGNSPNILDWIERSKEICVEFGLSLFVSKDKKNVSLYDKVNLFR